MPFSIQELIRSPESKTLEFKRDLSSPKNFLKTLTAFANSAGGRLIFGVADETHTPVGLESPLDDEERLCNMIADAIEPRLVPSIEMVSIEDKTLLVVEVFLSGSRPHFIKSEGPQGVYVRLGSTNRRADRELIDELKRGVQGAVFDETPLPELTIDALDLDAARKLFEDTRALDEKSLLTLKLLKRDQGRTVPTIGGLLLFGKEEREMRFPDAWVQCGRFIGTDKADIFDHTEITDHLPVAAERVIEFLKKHAMRGADFSEIRRKDVWSIPLGIIREVVINAIAHADYAQIGAPIRVAFFDDRIEVENPGVLLPGLTIDDIRQGVSKLRNRVITRVLRELNLIEQWGSGIPRIFKEARELKLPEPNIEEIGTRFRFTVYLPENHRSGPIQTPGAEQAAEQVTEQASEQVTGQVSRLLFSLKDQQLSTRELMDRLALKHRPTFLYDYLKPALENGLIEMTHPDAPRSPAQKYRLNPKGKRFIDQ